MPYVKRDGLPLCKRPGVYAITNKTNGKVYVGSALSVYGRLIAHRCSLRRGKHYNPHLQRAWDKHGEKEFRFDVLEVCGADQCLVKEQFWIDSLHVTDPATGYNICPVAGGIMEGRRHSEESRAKMSKQRKGMDTSRATAAAAKVAKGRKRPPEVRAKIAAGNRGKKRTDETKAKIKANHWSKKMSPEEVSVKMREVGRRGLAALYNGTTA